MGREGELSLMLGVVLGFLNPIARELRGAYRDRLTAETTQAKLDADERITVLRGAQDIARIEAADRWSATRLGRLLIVLPWGVHWALIYVVSIINPNFGTAFVIQAVPAHINDMAAILVPAIVLADAGALTIRRMRR